MHLSNSRTPSLLLGNLPINGVCYIFVTDSGEYFYSNTNQSFFNTTKFDSPNWQDYADIPFVIPSMCFPWEIFKPIEREYYTLLYLHLKNEKAHDPSNEIQPALFSITEEEDKSASSLFHLPSTGRKPHPFMPFFRAFELASLPQMTVFFPQRVVKKTHFVKAGYVCPFFEGK
ncbi:hypothetical protein L3V65_14870 [Heyndrickxia coagulans]|uniref:hypothetical protein n=1 Tax=Heyndrickxia coagulans TaxID=1398 RepID=UPI001F35A5A2|nr:hypothetical protein [Heyndrickxia coagulans]UJZ87459.1 hypothetical protein L3V65_14870 [Heyndrickxia coagulans]